MANEVNFCDSYLTPAPNRTDFPLSGGFISLNSEHPVWVFAVNLSTSANPQNFQAFSPAVPFFQVTGEGLFCFPVDFAASGISGLTDGVNVTIQAFFNGGDGNLFQCADLTLRSNATIPSGTTCTNATGDTVQTLASTAVPSPTNASSTGGSGASSTGSVASQTPSQTPSSANALAAGASGFLALVAALLTAL